MRTRINPIQLRTMKRYESCDEGTKICVRMKTRTHKERQRKDTNIHKSTHSLVSTMARAKEERKERICAKQERARIAKRPMHRNPLLAYSPRRGAQKKKARKEERRRQHLCENKDAQGSRKEGQQNIHNAGNTRSSRTRATKENDRQKEQAHYLAKPCAQVRQARHSPVCEVAHHEGVEEERQLHRCQHLPENVGRAHVLLCVCVLRGCVMFTRAWWAFVCVCGCVVVCMCAFSCL